MAASVGMSRRMVGAGGERAGGFNCVPHSLQPGESELNTRTEEPIGTQLANKF